MKKFDFSTAEMLLYSVEIGRRRILRDLLSSIGAQKCRELGDLVELRQLLHETTPDLIILDLDDDTEELCELAHDIRHDQVGHNPYCVVVAVTSDFTRGAISGAVNAGVDDIIIRPLSIAVLSERFNKLVEHRKEFVVTPSYVGPDRRKGKRLEGDELGTFRVPNTLRHKITGDMDAALNRHTLEAAAQNTVRHRLHRIATRVTQLATQLKTGKPARGAPKDPEVVKRQIVALLNQMGKTLNPRQHHHLIQLAASMREVMAIIASTEEPSARTYELFRLHGQAMAASLTEADDADNLIVHAINEATDVLGQDAQQATG